jgi:uncharacterized protein
LTHIPTSPKAGRSGAPHMGVPTPIHAAPENAATTHDERTMAVLAHVLQLVGGWIAPLVIFFVRRQSRFVSFHALQVLFLQLIYVFAMGCVIMLWFVSMFLTFLQAHANNNAPPLAAFLVFPLFWLGLMGMWVVTVVIAVVYSVKAGRGEWAEYPVLGALARRVLKIGPDGAAIS